MRSPKKGIRIAAKHVSATYEQRTRTRMSVGRSARLYLPFRIQPSAVSKMGCANTCAVAGSL